MMPAIAERYKLIAVDIRGMGDSDKPASGYGNKTLASDVYELVRALGYDRRDRSYCRVPHRWTAF
ncbi:hypothetical protein GCM10010464_58110 [Pseudonocardia yunnanensis]|uniref:Alpha/beta fold hydrolase n=1 Tax=Pseudonocardia yunnanensis TaxID=58107 RepID=A0ABW4F8F0_9PSEU